MDEILPIMEHEVRSSTQNICGSIALRQKTKSNTFRISARVTMVSVWREIPFACSLIYVACDYLRRIASYMKRILAFIPDNAEQLYLQLEQELTF